MADKTRSFRFDCSCGAVLRGSVPSNQWHHRARVRLLRRIFRELHVGPTHRRREHVPLAVAVEDERRLMMGLKGTGGAPE
jgi:hypothetical protein